MLRDFLIDVLAYVRTIHESERIYKESLFLKSFWIPHKSYHTVQAQTAYVQAVQKELERCFALQSRFNGKRHANIVKIEHVLQSATVVTEDGTVEGQIACLITELVEGRGDLIGETI